MSGLPLTSQSGLAVFGLSGPLPFETPTLCCDPENFKFSDPISFKEIDDSLTGRW
ncbi:MAG: hypothetical protein ACI8R4_004057 [Paracoccaceae bacterium]|jgi:hypothetical protein